LILAENNLFIAFVKEIEVLRFIVGFVLNKDNSFGRIGFKMLEFVQIGFVWQNRFWKYFFCHKRFEGTFRLDRGVKNLCNFVQN
jgi:hypothetical protein